jgi:hypothetical protein
MPELRHLQEHRPVCQRRRTQEFHGLGLQLPNTSCCRLASYEFEVPGPPQPPWLNRREPDGSPSRLAQGRRRRSSSRRECMACIGATSILSRLRPSSESTYSPLTQIERKAVPILCKIDHLERDAAVTGRPTAKHRHSCVALHDNPHVRRRFGEAD